MPKEKKVIQLAEKKSSCDSYKQTMKQLEEQERAFIEKYPSSDKVPCSSWSDEKKEKWRKEKKEWEVKNRVQLAKEEHRKTLRVVDKISFDTCDAYDTWKTDPKSNQLEVKTVEFTKNNLGEVGTAVGVIAAIPIIWRLGDFLGKKLVDLMESKSNSDHQTATLHAPKRYKPLTISADMQNQLEKFLIDLPVEMEVFDEMIELRLLKKYSTQPFNSLKKLFSEELSNSIDSVKVSSGSKYHILVINLLNSQDCQTLEAALKEPLTPRFKCVMQ